MNINSKLHIVNIIYMFGSRQKLPYKSRLIKKKGLVKDKYDC